MWTCAELKTRAKEQLRGTYWTAFVVCLIIIAIESVGVTLSVVIPFGPIAVAFLVMTVLYVGQYAWFSRNREAGAVPPVEQIFKYFKAETWGKTVGGMLWMYLFQFLWALLALVPYLAALPFFIIYSVRRSPGQGPGQWTSGLDDRTLLFVLLWVVLLIALSIPAYIKFYSYRMTPWILADNPQIGHERALKLSMALTRGHKGHQFLLDLSFIGWWLLVVLTAGLGMLFLYPYYLATQAELYAQLRQIGCDSGLCTLEELGYYPAAPSAS